MIKLIGIRADGTIDVLMHSSISGYKHCKSNQYISKDYKDIGDPSTIRIDSTEKIYSFLIDNIELYNSFINSLNKYLLSGKGILTITSKLQSFIPINPSLSDRLHKVFDSSQEDPAENFAMVTDVQYEE